MQLAKLLYDLRAGGQSVMWKFRFVTSKLYHYSQKDFHRIAEVFKAFGDDHIGNQLIVVEATRQAVEEKDDFSTEFLFTLCDPETLRKIFFVSARDGLPDLLRAIIFYQFLRIDDDPLFLTNAHYLAMENGHDDCVAILEDLLDWFHLFEKAHRGCQTATHFLLTNPSPVQAVSIQTKKKKLNAIDK